MKAVELKKKLTEMDLSKKIYGLGIRNRIEGFDADRFVNATSAEVTLEGKKTAGRIIIEKDGVFTFTLDAPNGCMQGKKDIIIKAQKEVTLHLIENIRGIGLAFQWNIEIERGAQVTLYRTLQAHHAYVFTDSSFILHPNSTLLLTEFIHEGNFVRTHAMSTISANANLIHTTLFRTTKEHDIKVSACLEGKEGKASLIARGVIEKDAKGLFLGELNITKDAVRSQGHQKSDLLLLSPTSIGEAVPVLEVENNDVTCSHSATISQIDPEMLFYLESRGISKTNAMVMIVEGFLKP
ncbi:SufD family Fe-S cluster assembly protein [Candidatus Woesearchaeota archaeon]|nr:SufD family Fe-S cluster assembly protein [Candidatus Woesearchaeota archaeon]